MSLPNLGGAIPLKKFIIEVKNTSPLDEQDICVNCGLCCDGTLFSWASLKAGEKEGLPVKMREGYVQYGTEEGFHLPCSYFGGKCTIYDQHKAQVCSSFRCQLLKYFSKEKVIKEQALDTVRNAVKLRNRIIKDYRIISGCDDKISYQELLAKIKTLLREETETVRLDDRYEGLFALCNILNALLTRHFKSPDEFEQMIVKEE